MQKDHLLASVVCEHQLLCVSSAPMSLVLHPSQGYLKQVWEEGKDTALTSPAPEGAVFVLKMTHVLRTKSLERTVKAATEAPIRP